MEDLLQVFYISKWRCHPFTFFRRPFFGIVCVLLVLFVNKPLIKSSKNAKIKFHSSRENVASDKGYPHPHTASYFNDHICFSLVRKTNSFSTFYYNDKIIHGHWMHCYCCCCCCLLRASPLLLLLLNIHWMPIELNTFYYWEFDECMHILIR